MNAQSKLFETALGIKKPLFISSIDFNSALGELHIHIDFMRGGRFCCPICGKEECGVYDTTDKVWRHLDFFQYKCYIHFRNPKIDCENCGVHLYMPVWARPRSGFTVLFEALILTLTREMSVAGIAKLVDEHDTRIWRVIHHHVRVAYASKNFSNLTQIGIDETSTRKGHNYISIFVDMTLREVVFATPSKDASTIVEFCSELERHKGTPFNINSISMDMSPAFISGAKAHLPQAEITFDKFHVIMKLNEVIDKIRRGEVHENPCLKGSKYLWLKNPDKLTESQKEKLKTLSKENKRLAKAYQMKITFQDIYRLITDVEAADFALRKWLSWAVRSRLDPIKEFAKMLKRHYYGVLQYFASRLTAGPTEGINNRIQSIKRRSKGFRNFDYFISLIYLDAANLTFPVFG